MEKTLKRSKDFLYEEMLEKIGPLGGEDLKVMLSVSRGTIYDYIFVNRCREVALKLDGKLSSACPSEFWSRFNEIKEGCVPKEYIEANNSKELLDKIAKYMQDFIRKDFDKNVVSFFINDIFTDAPSVFVNMILDVYERVNLSRDKVLEVLKAHFLTPLQYPYVEQKILYGTSLMIKLSPFEDEIFQAACANLRDTNKLHAFISNLL